LQVGAVSELDLSCVSWYVLRSWLESNRRHQQGAKRHKEEEGKQIDERLRQNKNRSRAKNSCVSRVWALHKERKPSVACQSSTKSYYTYCQYS